MQKMTKQDLIDSVLDYILDFHWTLETTAQAFATAIRAIESIDEALWENEPEAEK